MKRGGRLRVMKFLAHLLLMSLLGIKRWDPALWLMSLKSLVHWIPCFQALQDEVNGGEQTSNPQDYEPFTQVQAGLSFCCCCSHLGVWPNPLICFCLSCKDLKTNLLKKMENNAQAWAEVFCTSWSLKS
jgi:hypothetical protein